MDMSKDDIYYVPMLDLKDEIKYAEIEPCNYGTTYELENYSNAGQSCIKDKNPCVFYNMLHKDFKKCRNILKDCLE